MKYLRHIYRYISIIGLLVISFSCREEIALETESFESVLVVEATITNELKFQEVKVSRTYLLEETEQIIENNAEVRVIDNTGNSFNFSQNSEGIYLSDSEFEALPDVEYTLEINTTDGKTYSSNQQILTPISQIDNLYAEYLNDDVNGLGVQVFVDSENVNSEAKYFRYEYEETYQVIPSLYYSLEAELSNYTEIISPSNIFVFYDVEIVERIQEEKTCYNTITSKNIIQTTTNNFNQNTISRFPIRFIFEEIEAEGIGVPFEENVTIKDMSIIRDRYSILVKQYVQSLEAYTYYETINILGNSDSILSENQPGHVEGNINGENENEKILGFFEVASVSERRIFFNYSDFNLPLPDYIYQCDLRELNINDNTVTDMDLNERLEIYRLINQFSEYNLNYQITGYPEAIWSIANAECTDCTSVGTNIEPDFWVD